MYEDWELCLCDDGSADPELTDFLERLSASDSRVRTTVHESNRGISHSLNSAVSLSHGEFLTFLDQDDLLDPDALAEVSAVISDVAEVDLIYTDEDKINERGAQFQPFFKPDWAPDLLLAFPYVGHLMVVRRSTFDGVGGFRPEYDGSQDFDLMVRIGERARRVFHIPRVLYHWRAVSGSAASSEDAKPWAHSSSYRALTDAVQRQGISGYVEETGLAGSYHVRREVLGHPSVSVIIPFRDQAALTVGCLDSLWVDPGYDNFEVVLIDNASVEPESTALRRRLSNWPRIRILDDVREFNWSAINNAAAAKCESDLLLFMNNDIEATKPGWLRALVEQAQRPEVGAVGARLLFPDGLVQHAGVVLALNGIAGHIFTGLPSHQPGYFFFDKVIRPYSAVTAACMMCRREVFEELGGFDENLAVAFNDVDYCIRVLDAGYRIIYTPLAELLHHESISRGLSGFVRDYLYFFEKWDRNRLRNDPFYNPNLSLFAPWCSLRPRGENERWEALIDQLIGATHTSTDAAVVT